MTVRDDVKMRDEYTQLRFIEFLEFIGRVAHIRYIEEEDVPLVRKIERIMDALFPLFQMKRNAVDDAVEEKESSDESVFI